MLRGDVIVNRGTVGQKGALYRRRLLEKITMLCGCGAGLEAIASPLCAATRDLIGADSVSVFWLDAKRAPKGFYHDCAPAALKDMFVTRFDELFSSAEEASMISFTLPDGPSIGRALQPGVQDAFWQSNVHKYLCVPLGHAYILDMRVDVDGVGRALLCAWNKEGRPFTRKHADALIPVQAAMRHAIAHERADVRWRGFGNHTAHFITDVAGQTLLAIDTEAERILMAGHLLQQTISMTEPLGSPPGFARQLAGMLAAGEAATLHLPVADGRLIARAVHSQVRAQARRGAGDQSGQMFVSLALEVAVDVLMIDYLSALPLTLLQKQIALFAMQGHPRTACEEQLGVGAEALKKHLQKIFAATGVAHWADLARIEPAMRWPLWAGDGVA